MKVQLAKTPGEVAFLLRCEVLIFEEEHFVLQQSLPDRSNRLAANRQGKVETGHAGT